MSRSPVGAPRRRTRAPGAAVATSYANDARQINSSKPVGLPAALLWPDWTDAHRYGLTSKRPAPEGGAR